MDKIEHADAHYDKLSVDFIWKMLFTFAIKAGYSSDDASRICQYIMQIYVLPAIKTKFEDGKPKETENSEPEKGEKIKRETDGLEEEIFCENCIFNCESNESCLMPVIRTTLQKMNKMKD